MQTQAIAGWNEHPLRDVMLQDIPHLRAFAISLSGKVDHADDLVQETLLRAMANISSFQPGTNMSAWLTTILRNLFVSDYRKRRYEVQDTDGLHFDSLIVPPEQHSRLEFDEFREALARLPSDQREALLLVGACGFSCEEAATICESPVGTIKSRINRARTHLTKLLGSQLEPGAGSTNAQTLISSRMSANGTKRKCQDVRSMVANGAQADIARIGQNRRE